MKQTKVGSFNSARDYREHLVSLGYTDWGWQNGWGESKYPEWKAAKAKSTEKSEDIQWNRSGSDCTYAYHDLKIFCSVDMGD